MNTTTAAKLDSISQSLDRMIRSLESRIQMFDELFPTNSMESLTPTSTPSASLSSSAFSTTPSSPPTSTTPTSTDATKLCKNTTVDPLHDSPARCSTPSRSHDECALAPLMAAAAPVLTSSPVSSASPVALDAFPAPTASSTPTSIPSATSAEESSPTKCSTNCFNGDVEVLKPVNRLTCSRVRYITNSIPGYSIGVVLPCQPTKVHAVQKVFEVMSAQNSLMLEPLHASLVDKGPWPPPKQHCNILLCETIQLCFSFWLAPSGDGIIAQQSPPWPPPLLDCNKLLTDSVQIRPIPWPSFTSHTVVVYCSVNQSMVKLHMSKECLQHCLELYGTAMQVVGIKWKGIRQLQLSVGTYVILLKMDDHFCIFSDRARAAAFQSLFVKCWMQWGTPWALSQKVCWFGEGLMVIIGLQMLYQCYTSEVEVSIFSENISQALPLRWSSGLNTSLEFFVSWHTSQGILLINVHGFHMNWLTSLTMKIHSSIYDNCSLRWLLPLTIRGRDQRLHVHYYLKRVKWLMFSVGESLAGQYLFSLHDKWARCSLFSCFGQYGHAKPVGEHSSIQLDQVSSTESHYANSVNWNLSVPIPVTALKWSICWVFTDYEIIQSQQTILCKMLLLQICISCDQWPPFSCYLLIGINSWACHSNGGGGDAIVPNCKCILLHEVWSPGWYSWVDHSNDSADLVLTMESTLECMVEVSINCLMSNVFPAVMPSVFLDSSSNDLELMHASYYFVKTIVQWLILGLLHPKFQGAVRAERSFLPYQVPSPYSRPIAFQQNGVKVSAIYNEIGTAALIPKWIDIFQLMYLANGRVDVVQFSGGKIDLTAAKISGQADVLQYWQLLVELQSDWHFISSSMFSFKSKFADVHWPWSISSIVQHNSVGFWPCSVEIFQSHIFLCCFQRKQFLLPAIMKISVSVESWQQGECVIVLRHKAASANEYVNISLSQRCFSQFWKPPWQPSVHDLFKWRFAELTLSRQSHARAFAMFLWLALTAVMKESVLAMELTPEYTIQSVCTMVLEMTESLFVAFCGLRALTGYNGEIQSKRKVLLGLAIISSIMLQHVITLGFTISKKMEQSSLGASSLMDVWLNTLGCSSYVSHMRYVLLKLFIMKHMPTLAGNPMRVQLQCVTNQLDFMVLLTWTAPHMPTLFVTSFVIPRVPVPELSYFTSLYSRTTTVLYEKVTNTGIRVLTFYNLKLDDP